MKSKEEIEALLNSSQESIKESISSMDKDTFGAVLSFIGTLSKKEQRVKLLTILSCLTTHESFEDVGRFMTVELFSSFIDIEREKNSSMLKPILVGLPPSIFMAFLEHAESKALDFLKREVSTEPLQHQIVAALSLGSSILENLFEHYEEARLRILEIRHEELTSESLNSYYAILNTLHSKAAALCKLMDNLLLLAWNSEHSELILNLSTLKEKASKFLVFDVGRKLEGKAPTGLFHLLKGTLEAVFYKEDPLRNTILLKDDYPALEALSCFSLWYIEDYKKIGLINGTEEEKEKDLYLLAKLKLEKMGIKTVHDLKEKEIYSVKMLKEHLAMLTNR